MKRGGILEKEQENQGKWKKKGPITLKINDYILKKGNDFQVQIIPKKSRQFFVNSPSKLKRLFERKIEEKIDQSQTETLEKRGEKGLNEIKAGNFPFNPRVAKKCRKKIKWEQKKQQVD